MGAFFFGWVDRGEGGGGGGGWEDQMEKISRG